MTGPAALGRWWRLHAIAQIDHDAVVAKVVDESGWSPRYIFMTLISAGIALIGLLLSSPAVVIGAMLISPLMGPIMGLGFAFALFDFRELRGALVALVAGSVIAVLFTALITFFSPLQTVTAEIAARTRPNLFDLMVALLSALAGAYAMIRGRSGTIVGVAIATALMPPLATVGFGLATRNWTVFDGALLLFVTNLVTIALTTTGLARLYGFGARLSPTQTQLQAGLLVTVLIGLAIPLGLALRQIAWESFASREIRDALLARFPDEARLSQVDIDFDHDPVTVRAVVLTPKLVHRASQAASRALSASLGHPVEVNSDQLLISGGAASSDSAQLAAAQAVTSAPAAGVLPETAGLRRRIALVAGIAAEAVTLDPQSHRAIARAAPLPGGTLATWRALEGRLAATAPDWSVELVPPPGDLPAVAFDGDVPTPAGRDALALAGWASARTGLAVHETGGNPARRAAALAIIAAAGGHATGTVGGATLQLTWAAP